MAKKFKNGVVISKGVYKCISPIFLLSRITGLCPVEIVKNRTCCNLVWSRKVLLSGFAFTILLVGSASYGLVQNYKVEEIYKVRLGSISASICTISENVYLLFTCLAGTLIIPIYFPHFITYLERINKADSLLLQKNLNQTKRCIIVMVIVLSMTFVTLIMDFSIWVIVASEEITWGSYLKNNLPFFATYVYQIVLELHFWLMVHFIYLRLACLNESLSSVLEDREGQNFPQHINEYINTKLVHVIKSKSLDNRKENIAATKVKTTAKIHHLLYEAGVAINDYFGVHVLIILLGCMIHLLVTPYDLYDQLKNTGDHLFIAGQIIWLLGHILRLFFIIEPCQACKYQTQRTVALLCRIIAEEDCQDTKTQLQVFLQQMEQCQIQFTACGLVNIDRTLLTTVAGTVTTYLVILFQFNK